MKSSALFIVVGMAVSLIGCAPATNDRVSTEVEISNFKDKYRINNRSNIKKLADNLIYNYQYEMINNKIDIEWNDSATEVFARKLADKIDESGFDANIRYNPNFDEPGNVIISISGFRAKVDVCEYLTSDQMLTDKFGCFVEANRWSSMVYPRKMLLEKDFGMTVEATR